MADDLQPLIDTLQASQRLYLQATDQLGKARTLRAQAISELLKPGGLSVRAVADLLDMQPSQVQTIYDTLWTHRVGFMGRLSPEAEEALNDAGIALRFSRGGGSAAPGAELPPVTKHGVYLVADSDKEALAIVKRALKGKGEFIEWTVEESAGKRD